MDDRIISLVNSKEGMDFIITELIGDLAIYGIHKGWNSDKLLDMFALLEIDRNRVDEVLNKLFSCE